MMPPLEINTTPCPARDVPPKREPRDRPILFSAPMVRALLAGTKTQTRRVVKPQPTEFVGGPGVTLADGSPAPLVPLDDTVEPYGREISCPYGRTGDRLWVREAWARAKVWDADIVVYREGDNRTDYGGPWKPGIHMFRADSRILLEVTGVRVERLQDISEADAIAEGIEPGAVEGRWRIYGRETDGSDMDASHRVSYRSLWESINGAGSWDRNDWVWVVEFRCIVATNSIAARAHGTGAAAAFHEETR